MPLIPDPDAGSPRVRIATPADLNYVVHLQKKHGRAIGFLPRAALAEKIDLGRIWLALENDEPAGFLHHGSLGTAEVRVFQAAIQYNARRRHLGTSLVQNLLDRAAAAGAGGVSLRCLSFLEANRFWRGVEFNRLGVEPGAKGTLNVWTKRIGAASPSFHSRLHPCPRCGAPTTDTWTAGARRHRLCAACAAQFSRTGGKRG